MSLRTELDTDLAQLRTDVKRLGDVNAEGKLVQRGFAIGFANSQSRVGRGTQELAL